MTATFRMYADREELYRAAADCVVHIAKRAVCMRGYAALALSGGATPRPLYALLASEAYRRAVPWDNVHLFWADERMVSPDDAASNYRTVYDELLSRIDIPALNIHAPPTAGNDAAKAARAYDAAITSFFNGQKMPSFDLVLLGMGSDGHAASLFPGETALAEEKRGVVAVDGLHADPAVPRITMTLRLINASRHIAFLVTGADKMKIVDEIEHKPHTAVLNYPAAMIEARNEVVWFGAP